MLSMCTTTYFICFLQENLWSQNVLNQLAKKRKSSDGVGSAVCNCARAVNRCAFETDCGNRKSEQDCPVECAQKFGSCDNRDLSKLSALAPVRAAFDSVKGYWKLEASCSIDEV